MGPENLPNLEAALAALAVFKDHLPLLLAIIVIAAIVGSRLQRWVDDGEIRKLKAGWDGEVKGLKAENNALKEQLHLAHGKQEVVTNQLAALESLARSNEAEIAELKVKVARMEPSTRAAILPQVDKVVSTSVTVTTSVHNLSAANLAVGEILSRPSGKLNLITDAPKVQATSKSE